MNTTYAENGTLVGTWLAPLDGVRTVALVIVFSLLVALAAQIVIPLPFTPVPVTGQTFAVLLAGALLGSRLGAAAMILYIVEGAIGLPVFRGGEGGFAYLLGGQTIGYLLSFPLAAYIVGLLAEHGWDRKYLTAAAAMFIGSVIVLFCGWAWIARTFGASDAFLLGVAPFLVGDVIKIAVAAALLPKGWALLRNQASQKR